MKAILPVLLALLVSTGCRAPQLSPTDVGKTAVFPEHSKKEVYEAAAKVMTEKLSVIEQDLAQGSIKAELQKGMPTWGSVVAAYVSELPDGGIQLKVVSKKRARWQIGSEDWASTIINAVKIELDVYD